jgi:MarR family transcriptional regulator, transcriptional regulator for hemolysin
LGPAGSPSLSLHIDTPPAPISRLAAPGAAELFPSYRIREDLPYANCGGRERGIVLYPYYQLGIRSAWPCIRAETLDLDRSFGFLLNDVARLFGRRFDLNGKRLGLTRAQCRTLGYLARNEGINQAGLADLLEIRPMTLVRQIDRMEEAGWIERRADPSDRRARRLYLTAKARPVLGRIWDVATETRDEVLVRLSPQEAEQLIDLLHRVHATLSDRIPLSDRAPAGTAEPLTSAPTPGPPVLAPVGRALHEPVGDPAMATEVSR